MPLTLSPDQQSFMRARQRVKALAVWAIQAENHIAARVRDNASVKQAQTPTRQAVQLMVDYLSSDQISPSDLVHLINGFNNRPK